MQIIKQNCRHNNNGWCGKCVSALLQAIEQYRNNDGSRSRYDVIAVDKARLAIDLIMCPEFEPDSDMGRMEHDDRGDN